MATQALAALPAAIAASTVKVTAYVPVIKPFVDDVGALVSLGTWLLIIIGLAFAAKFIHKEWIRDPLIIEPFDTPKELQDLGLTGSVISQQLYDALVELQRSARPDDGHSDISFIELPRLQVDLQLPGISWSVRSAIRYFRHLFGRQERRLLGEVCKSGRSYSLRIRSSSAQFVDVPVRFHGVSDLGAAMRAAAEAALPLTSTLEAAALFLSLESPRLGYDRTLAALRAHLATAPIGTHQDAYVLWASLLRNLGDEAGMQAKLDLARLASISTRTGRETARLGVRFHNFTGSLHRERREFMQAEKSFTLALNADPRNIAAMSNMGLLHLDQGNFETARRWFRQVIGRNARSSRGYRGLGLIADREADLRAALRYLGRAVDLAPRARWARVNQAETHFRMGQLDVAERALDALQALDPGFAPAYRYRSRICRERGEVVQAMKWAIEACEADPADPWGWIERCQAALAMADPAAAVASAREVIRLRPQFVEGYRWQAQALSFTGDRAAAIALLDQALERADDVWTRLDKAALLRRAGQRAQALELLHEACARWPRSPDVRRRIATLHRDAGDLASAESVLWQAVGCAQGDVYSWVELGEVQRLQGRLDAALACVERARQTWSHPARALRLQAQIQLDRYQADEAEKSLREAMGAQTSDVWALLDLVELMRSQERYAEAASLCGQALERRCRVGAVLRRWAWVLLDMGDVSGARRKMFEALQAAQYDIDVWTDGVQFLLKVKDAPEALRVAETLADRWPAEVRGAVALGRARAELGDVQAAQAGFQQAMRLEPGAGWIAGAWIWALWRRDPGVIELAEQRVGKSPDSVDEHLQLAHLYRGLGRFQAALDVLERAVALSKPWDDRALLLQSQTYLDARNAVKAIERAHAALERRQRPAQALRLVARGLRAKDAVDEALDRWREAAHWDACSVDDLLEIASIEHSRGRQTEARAACADALARRPQSVRARRQLLRFLVDVQDMPAARKVLDELLELLPAEVEDLLSWSEQILLQPDPNAMAEALHTAATATHRQPDLARAWARWAELLLLAGDPVLALEKARQARRLLPTSDPRLSLRVALLLAQACDVEPAVALAQQVTPQIAGDVWLFSDAARVFEVAVRWDLAVESLNAALEIRPDDEGFQVRRDKAMRAGSETADTTAPLAH